MPVTSDENIAALLQPYQSDAECAQLRWAPTGRTPVLDPLHDQKLGSVNLQLVLYERTSQGGKRTLFVMSTARRPSQEDTCLACGLGEQC